MPEQQPLRVAYIGAGGFSNGYVYPQLASHGVHLAAVCDLVEERARAAAARYGFAQVYADFERMLDIEQPDAVICIGGPAVHHPVGLRVLARGLPLYIQKSPAPTAAATQELVAAAAAQHTICHVGFNLRYSVAGQAARQTIADPSFGPVTLVIVRYGLVSGATLRDAVMDQHCHAYDLLRWLGGEVAEIVARPGAVPGDRGYAAVVRFANGAVGSLNFTAQQTPDKEFVYFEVTGTNGHYLTCHDFDLRTIAPGEPDRWYTQGHYGGGLAWLRWLGYVSDLANFFAAVRGAADDRSPVADSVATMALCEDVYQQLRDLGAPA